MTEARKPDSRQRLLDAAAELVAAAPGEDVPLRAVCERAGVRMPTLYHYFGSKQGLLDAVIEHGFASYVDRKKGHPGSGDPIADLRAGWDDHVAFGLSRPAFYVLMYGQVRPGRRPAAAAGPETLLLGITRRAAAEGRLVVTAELAARHVLATNVGVTLHQISAGEPDPDLSASVREATIAAIAGPDAADTTAGLAERVRAMARELSANGGAERLGEPEMALLEKWLGELADPG